VVGVPGRARLRRGARDQSGAEFDLEHNVLHDTTMEMLQELHERTKTLERELAAVRASQLPADLSHHLSSNDGYAARTMTQALHFDI
jgi:hypothetical protein